MLRPVFLRCLVSLYLALCGLASHSHAQQHYYALANSRELVKFISITKSADIKLTKLANQAIESDERSAFYRIEGSLSPTLLAHLRALPGVRYVEPARDAMPLFLPNDPAAQTPAGGQAPILTKIQAYDAWDLSKGDTSVMIGILDTGVDIAHPDMMANLGHNVADPINGVDDDRNGYVDDYNGYDLSNNDNDPRPDGNARHGTQVASISSAAFDNGLGLAGLAGRCKYLPVKVYGTRFTGYEGILYATDRGCKVINLSWGNNGYPSQFEQDVIDYATSHGAIVVAAAGNTAGILRFYPASYRGVVSVGFTQISDNRDASSTVSPEVAVMAPGIDVFGITTTGTYGNIGGGSSYAAPMVSALAALAISRYPTSPPQDIVALIRAGADPIDQLPANRNMAGYIGSGRINMARTLRGSQDAYPQITAIIPDPRQADLRAGLCGITLSLINRLADASRISICLSIIDSVQARNVTLVGPDSLILNQIVRDSVLSIPPAQGWTLRLLANETAPIRLRASIRTGTSTYYQSFALDPGYLWQNITGPLGQLTLGSNARLGYWDTYNSFGSGFTRLGRQVLGEGGILVGTDSLNLLNNVSGVSGKDNDFTGTSLRTVRTDSVYQVESLSNSVRSSGGRLKLAMGVKGYAWPNQPANSGIITEFTLANADSIVRDSLRFGVLADWDINRYWLNQSRWDTTGGFGYTYAYGDTAYTALVPLSPGLRHGFFAIDAVPVTATGNIDVTDGFSKNEKWRTLIRERRSAGGLAGTNNVLVYHAALPPLPAQGSQRVAYAWVAGPSLAALRQAASGSRAQYRRMRQGRNWPFANQISNCLHGRMSIVLPPGRWEFRDSLNAVLFAGRDSFTFTLPLPIYKLQVQELDSLFPGPSTTLTIRSSIRQDSLIRLPDSVAIGTPLSLTVLSPLDTTLEAVAVWRNDSLVSMVLYGLDYTPRIPGTYRFCYEVVHRPTGCLRISCSNEVVVQSPVGIRPSGGAEHLPRPNPASALLEIPATSQPQQILDAQGRIVWTSEGEARQLSVGTWPRGIYLWQSGERRMRLVLQ